MKYNNLAVLFAVIAISLLAATGCKPIQNTLAQDSPVQDTVATPDSQQNSNAPAVDEPHAQPDPSVVQNPSDDADAQVNQALPPEPTEVKEYVDIADWCRPNMSVQISAQEWAKANNAQCVWIEVSSANQRQHRFFTIFDRTCSWHDARWCM